MKTRPDEAKTIDHRMLPTGVVLGNPVKRGEFLALPLFGWVGKRAETHTPLVMVTVLLLASAEDPMPKGTLQIELPVFPETEGPTIALLQRFGWDGRVWPPDAGWPTGSPDDEGNILVLMEQAGLEATLAFPPNDSGAAAPSVKVERARGPFLMPPLEKPQEELDPMLVERLRALCADPTIFFAKVEKEAK